jgi:hypothetical protein
MILSNRRMLNSLMPSAAWSLLIIQHMNGAIGLAPAQATKDSPPSFNTAGRGMQVSTDLGLLKPRLGGGMSLTTQLQHSSEQAQCKCEVARRLEQVSWHDPGRRTPQQHHCGRA